MSLQNEMVWNAETRQWEERWVEMPNVLTEAQAQAKQAAADATLATVTTNTRTIEQNAETALAELRGFIARPSGTITVAIMAPVVKTLCKVAIGLIRLRLSKLDATD